MLRDDLLREVMRMLRLHSAQAKGKQNLSRLAGSGGSVLRIGITSVSKGIISFHLCPPRKWVLNACAGTITFHTISGMEASLRARW